MDNFAINNLANMEYMLYGGRSGMNRNCPSMYNGYMGVNNMGINNNLTNYYNPMFRGYNTSMNGYYSPSAADSVFSNPQVKTAAAAGAGAIAGAASSELFNKDMNVLADYATKINEGGETFFGALTGGLTFAAFENPQNVKHWWNALKGVKEADKIFDLKNDNIKALWDNKETRELMQRAYSQTQAAYRRMGSKWAGVHNWFAKPFSEADKKTVNEIIKNLEKEIVKGSSANKEVIAKYTEQLRATRGMDGYIPSAWNWVKNHTWNKLVPGSAEARNYDASHRVARKAATFSDEAIKKSLTLSNSAKFMKEFKGWFLFETVIEGVTKVLPTYMEGGSDSGNKQLVQSGVKAAASAAGWSVGRLAGGVLGAKAGAAIGTCFGPGVGTAIGAVIGFAGGCVGSWLAGKGVKALIGKDESEKLAEAKMTKTQEGQAQLLQLAMQKAQTGEAPKEVVNSLNNILKQAV